MTPHSLPRRILGAALVLAFVLVGSSTPATPSPVSLPATDADQRGAPQGLIAGATPASPSSLAATAPPSTVTSPSGVWMVSGAPSLPAGRTVTTERLNPMPAPSLGDASLVTRQGTWAWANPSHGDRYLATPEKRGTQVRVCGPRDCLTLTTNDVGPALYLQRAGRIGDLSAATFEVICGELRFGLCPGSYTVLQRAPLLTDEEETP